MSTVSPAAAALAAAQTFERCDRPTDNLPAVLDPLPSAARKVLDRARERGLLWIVAWNHDSADAPYVSITIGWEVAPDDTVEHRMTWHSRGTGTLRLFSCISRGHGRHWHDTTVTRVLTDLTRANPA